MFKGTYHRKSIISGRERDREQIERLRLESEREREREEGTCACSVILFSLQLPNLLVFVYFLQYFLCGFDKTDLTIFDRIIKLSPVVPQKVFFPRFFIQGKGFAQGRIKGARTSDAGEVREIFFAPPLKKCSHPLCIPFSNPLKKELASPLHPTLHPLRTF